MFAGITPEICAKAWDAIVPAIRHSAETGLIREFVGSVAILNPANPDGPVLFTADLTDEPRSFAEFAEAKARVSHRTGQDTTNLRSDFPHLYQPGDIKWPGGIHRNGLAVGFSGVEGEYDVMIAEWFVSAIRAICRIEFYGPEGEGAQAGPYLGQ